MYEKSGVDKDEMTQMMVTLFKNVLYHDTNYSKKQDVSRCPIIQVQGSSFLVCVFVNLKE